MSSNDGEMYVAKAKLAEQAERYDDMAAVSDNRPLLPSPNRSLSNNKLVVFKQA